MRFIFLKLILSSIAIDIHGWMWYKPQHIFDKVTCALDSQSKGLSYFLEMSWCSLEDLFFIWKIWRTLERSWIIKLIYEFLLSLFRWGHSGRLHPAYIQWDNTGRNIEHLWNLCGKSLVFSQGEIYGVTEIFHWMLQRFETYATHYFSHLKCQSSVRKISSMSFYDLPWPSMLFYELDLIWSNVYYIK